MRPTSKVASCIGCPRQWLSSVFSTQPHRASLPVQHRGKTRAVRRHQQAATAAADQIARQTKHCVRGGLVEVSGRLIRQHQPRPGRQRAADRHPLLLAAGELLRVAPQQIAKAEPVDQFSLPALVITPGDPRLKRQIVGDVETRDQIELLENKADLAAPDLGKAAVRQRRDVLAFKIDHAAVGIVEARDQMQQRALAAAGFADQRHALARCHDKIDPAQHADRLARRTIGLFQSDNLQHHRPVRLFPASEGPARCYGKCRTPRKGSSRPVHANALTISREENKETGAPPIAARQLQAPGSGGAVA